MEVMRLHFGCKSCGYSAAVLFLVAPAVAQQQDTGDTADTASRGRIADYLFRTVKLSGSLRLRWESGQGSDFRVTPAPWYVLTRARFRAAFRPLWWLNFAAEAQDARAIFYRVKPSGSVQDPFDLRQAYLELGASESTLMARVGRQELTLGSGRLIASLDWSNTARLYDVARARLNTKSAKLDLVAGSIVQIDPDRVDRHKPGEHFYAGYLALPSVLPAGSIEPYAIVKTQLSVKGKDGVAGGADTYALGGRIVGAAPRRLDYSLEAVRETGNYANDILQAFGFVSSIGWRIATSNGPRVVAEYVYSSGDNGRQDRHRETFDNMYGFNQPTNSLTGQFGWRNLTELRVGVEFRPLPKLKANLDLRNFAISNVQDGLYNASGSRTVWNPKATNAHVGFGPDVQITMAIWKGTSLGVGLGTLFPGEYLRQSGKTTGFLYPSVSVTRKL